MRYTVVFILQCWRLDIMWLAIGCLIDLNVLQLKPDRIVLIECLHWFNQCTKQVVLLSVRLFETRMNKNVAVGVVRKRKFTCVILSQSLIMYSCSGLFVCLCLLLNLCSLLRTWWFSLFIQVNESFYCRPQRWYHCNNASNNSYRPNSRLLVCHVALAVLARCDGITDV